MIFFIYKPGSPDKFFCVIEAFHATRYSFILDKVLFMFCEVPHLSVRYSKFGKVLYFLICKVHMVDLGQSDHKSCTTLFNCRIVEIRNLLFVSFFVLCFTNSEYMLRIYLPFSSLLLLLEQFRKKTAR